MSWLRQFLLRFWQDVRFAWRVSAASPKFVAVAVLTLAIGIAVNSTVFSWIDSVLLHPYSGVKDANSLALIETVTVSGERLVATSYFDYRDYRDNLKLVSAVAIGRFTPLSVGLQDNAERAWAELVSVNYFDVLRVKPALGRSFLPEEGADRPGAFPVAVISYRMWQRRFHGDRNVLGKEIRLNRHQLTIIGVAPAGFRGSTVGVGYDVWMPIGMADAMGAGGTLHYRGCRDLTSTIVRLKPGVSMAQAGDEVAALAKQLAAAYPETNRGVSATVVPVWAGHLGAQGVLLKPLQILMSVSVLLLIVACANVANLLLSRAVARQKEFGLRLAFGAQRGRLIQQLLTETLLLTVAGAGAGVLIMIWVGESLNGLLPAMDFPFDLRAGLSPATFGFTLLIVVAVTCASGLVPALVAVRKDVSQVLNEGGRSGIGGTRSGKLRRVLVGVEVALATIAMASAGLFLRSFHNASQIHPGFNTSHVAVAQFYLSYAGYSAQEQTNLCRALRERLEAVPGIQAVTYTDFVPLTAPNSSPEDELEVEGYVPAENEQMLIHRATVAPGYFQFMSIPLLEGRDFTEKDDASAPQFVMIVNESFARRFFGGASAVGHRVKFAGNTAIVVGEVKDSKYNTPIEPAAPYFYLPFRQWFTQGLNFAVLVKSTEDPMEVIPELRRQALALNQDAYFHSVRLSDAVGYSIYPQKVAGTLLAVVGALCVLLAAVGLYSVLSYDISMRTREFGVRMALGANRVNVVAQVIGNSLLLTVPGMFAGFLAVVMGSRFFREMLVQVSPSDPLTLAASAVLLIAVTLLASYAPASRATRIEPMVALRCQ